MDLYNSFMENESEILKPESSESQETLFQEIDQKDTSEFSRKFKQRLSVLGVAAVAATTFTGVSEIPQRPNSYQETMISSHIKDTTPRITITVPQTIEVSNRRNFPHPPVESIKTPVNPVVVSEAIPQEGIIVTKVPYIPQVYTEDCETASLQMALGQLGINLSQQALLDKENVQEQAPVMNGSTIVKWGDPYTSFVGNPNGDQLSYPPTGYGTYYSNIARLAEAEGAKVLFSGVGLTQDQIVQYIRENHPVIAWVDDNNNGVLEYSPLNHWTAFDGRLVEYPRYGNEHNVLIIGIRKVGGEIEVLINDPLKFIGPEWVSMNNLWNSMRTFNYSGVVLTNPD